MQFIFTHAAAMY